jgi:exodeoxyribonuclease-1
VWWQLPHFKDDCRHFCESEITSRRSEKTKKLIKSNDLIAADNYGPRIAKAASEHVGVTLMVGDAVPTALSVHQEGHTVSFIFYDTETTGKRSGFDQILQFAGILTDDALDIQDTFSIRSRLQSHIVPSPEALLVTGIGVSELTGAPLSHFEMMRRIRAKMCGWSEVGAVFIGWNNLRFDEAMLRQAYYQTLLPIYQTNTNGNGRADVMRMAQIVAACAPNTITIPLGENGKQSFKLGLVAETNAVSLDNAHDALADAGATLAVARLIKLRAPALWEAMVALARKAAPLHLIKNNSVLLLSETYGGVAYNLMVTPIATNANNANEWALFDLRFDPLPLLDAADQDLRNAINGKVKSIRRTSINAQPPLFPIDFAPNDIRGGRLSLETYRVRAQAIREHADFARRVARLLAERYADEEPSPYVEENIYAGFAASKDEARMTDFHACDWAARPDIVGAFDDERFRELGERIIAGERRDLLSDERGRHWETWRRNRLLSEGAVPWLTITNARVEIDALLDDASPDQRRHLGEIQQLLVGMGA